MKLNTLNKIPPLAHLYIVHTWGLVYTHKTISKGRGWNLVEGVLYGIYWTVVDSDSPENFTGDDLNAVLRYYEKWFSL